MLEGPLSLYNKFIHYIVGGMALLTLGLGLGWYVTNLKLDNCQAARAVDKTSYEKAAAESLAQHLEAIKKKEQEYVAKARQADASYASLSARFNDSLRLYTEANKRATSIAVTGSRSSSAEGDNRSGTGPNIPASHYTQPELDITEVSVVSIDDLTICAENTARLIVARDWALGLNE